MSDRKKPLTALEESGLIAHRLPIGKPSQLADAFRHGIAWAERARLSEPEWIPVGERLPVVPEGMSNVDILVCDAGGETVTPLRYWVDDGSIHLWTHWRYAEPTPQPPKDNP